MDETKIVLKAHALRLVLSDPAFRRIKCRNAVGQRCPCRHYFLFRHGKQIDDRLSASYCSSTVRWRLTALLSSSQPCRDRHLKCDQELPSCSRCRDNGRECIKKFNYRLYKAPFRKTQRWVNIQRPLEYIDETHRVSNFYASDIDSSTIRQASEVSSCIPSPCFVDGNEEIVATPQNDGCNDLGPTIVPSSERFCPGCFGITHELSTASTLLADSSSQFSALDYSLSNTPSSHVPETSLSSTGTHLLPASTSHSRRHSLHQSSEIFLSSCPPVGLRLFPLTNCKEAILLRHYILNLAPWLDLCDPHQHFQTVVPQRARSSLILLNAIFALSARHLHKTKDYDQYESNMYHDECLKYLIPILNDVSSISNDTIFAATIILRVLEEIEVADIGTDPSQHLLGIQVFVSAINPAPMRGDLIEACFWIGLRQEIYSSLTYHNPLKLNLEHCHIDRSLRPTSDHAWANRAIVHCADILNLCFGDASKQKREWSHLRAYNDNWKTQRPPSFDPFLSSLPAPAHPLPEIWHAQASHIIGIQHNILASLLLHIFDPSIPRTGPQRYRAERALQPLIRQELMQLCGIGLSNDWSPPAMFTASMGITLCGDRIGDQEGREALMEILEKTERDHARPTRSVRNILRESWGWGRGSGRP